MLSQAISLQHKQRLHRCHVTEETRWKGQKMGGLLILGCRMGVRREVCVSPRGEIHAGTLEGWTVGNTQATLTSSPRTQSKTIHPSYIRHLMLASVCCRLPFLSSLSTLHCIEITAMKRCYCLLLIITLVFKWALETEVGMWPLASCSLLKCAVEVTGAGCIWDMKLFLCISRIWGFGCMLVLCLCLGADWLFSLIGERSPSTLHAGTLSFSFPELLKRKCLYIMHYEICNAFLMPCNALYDLMNNCNHIYYTLCLFSVTLWESIFH